MKSNYKKLEATNIRLYAFIENGLTFDKTNLDFTRPLIMTTIEQCLPIIKLVKYTALFPYSFVHIPEPVELTTSTARMKHIHFETNLSWRSFLFRITVQAYLAVQLAFGYTQIFQAIFFNTDYTFSTAVSPLCGNLLATCAFGITVVSNQKKLQITRLLNQWHMTELEIDSKQATSAYTFVRSCLIFFVGWTGLTTTFHAITFPRHLAYLYSRTDPSADVFWFQLISACEVNLFNLLLWAEFSQLDLMGVIFPSWVQQSLHSLSPQSNGDGQYEPNIFSLCPQSSFRYYSKLNDLVSGFNSIFGNLLVGIKLVALIAICLLLYVPIRHPSGTPIAIAHFTSLLVVVIKVGSSLMPMGAVQKESNSFKDSWIYSLGNNLIMNSDWNQNSWKIAPFFHFVSPISFRGGSFYDIQPSTILTFFSVATTYIIVVLQI